MDIRGCYCLTEINEKAAFPCSAILCLNLANYSDNTVSHYTNITLYKQF